MNFSEALDYIKMGLRMTRVEWDNCEKFVYLVHGSKFEVNREPLNAMFEMGKAIEYRPHLDLCDHDGSCGMWTPSNEDLLASDWAEVGSLPVDATPRSIPEGRNE